MKKRTKITLTIVGLLALTGVFYAANPVPFVSTIPFPTGVAAVPDLLIVSEYCNDQIDKVDCQGNVSFFADIPGIGDCREKYLAIAPSQSATAGFTPRDVFVTSGVFIYKATPPGPLALFATIDCNAHDHTGITFDHFGTFGFNMIVTCRAGGVFQIDGTGTVTLIADTGADTAIEGPAVVPPGFGPNGGEIWVADEKNSQVHAIKNDGTVTLNLLSHVTAESVHVIPSPPCTFCSGGAFFQAEQQLFRFVWQYPLSDFIGLGGNVILVSETGGAGVDTSLVRFDGTNYVQSSFGPRPPGVNEGSSFVDCDVPTATPTATASPSPTATFTPTPTATATDTATATATPTPTPTPTATATPVCVFSASIPHNFNSSPISAGNYIWFTAVLTPANLGSARVTFTFTGQTITIPTTPAITLNVPDATVIFDPAVNFATTTFGPGGVSTTTAPSNPLLGGWTLFSALVYQVPTNLPGGIQRVLWEGALGVDTPDAKVQGWKWAAAVYPNPHFSLDYNLIGVKPVDATTQNPYLNADNAGTPENFKTFVISGATGGGATNYTGGYSATKSFTCKLRRH